MQDNPWERGTDRKHPIVTPSCPPHPKPAEPRPAAGRTRSRRERHRGGSRAPGEAAAGVWLQRELSWHRSAEDEPYLSPSNQRQIGRTLELFLLCRLPFFA